MTATRVPNFEQRNVDDPREFAAFALTHFPDARQSVHVPGSDKPPPMVALPVATLTAPVFSKLLWDLGFRHHPDLMTLYPLPSVDGNGWLDAPRYVSRDEYEAHRATLPSLDGTSSDGSSDEDTLKRLLGAINPTELARIEAMTPEERAAALPAAKAAAIPAFERLAQLREQMQQGSV